MSDTSPTVLVLLNLQLKHINKTRLKRANICALSGKNTVSVGSVLPYVIQKLLPCYDFMTHEQKHKNSENNIQKHSTSIKQPQYETYFPTHSLVATIQNLSRPSPEIAADCSIRCFWLAQRIFF